MSIALPVVVTLSPFGAICDVTVGGISIAGAIPNGQAQLAISGNGGMPTLDVLFHVDEIVMKKVAL